MTMRRSEFAKLCGVTPAYLANYVRRGKVIVTGKEVDETLPENIEFKATRTNGSTPKSKATKAASPPTLTKKEKAEQAERLDQVTRRNLATIEKLEVEVKLKKMQAAKLSGEAIPLDIAMDVVSQFGQSYLTAFRDFCENFVMDMSHKSRWTGEQLADARGKIIEGMNVSMENAQSVAQVDLEELAESYKLNKKPKR